jgi:monothiol glutaredoxin
MGIISRFKKRLPIVGGTTPSSAEPTSGGPEARPAAPPPPAPETARGEMDAQEYIAGVVGGNPITLFMKGNPTMPQCGFSANAVAILSGYGHPLKTVDVLADPEVRQGVKDFSNWPTIPQVYVGGEFLGGSDILAQMHQSGELGEVIEAAVAGSEG